jgi:hypothetical protein
MKVIRYKPGNLPVGKARKQKRGRVGGILGG